MANGLSIFSSEALSAKDFLLEEYNLILEENPLRLEGTIPLVDNDGELIDNYKIKIVPTEEYPKEFPLVYELDSRLPYNIDWHIYPDGHFCIKAFPEEILICKNNLSLLSFIKEQVIPFLFNQKHREEYGYFLKERAHGTEGNLEFFQDTFKTKDLTRIKHYLEFIAKREIPNRVSMCFCGSGIKYRKCHRESYQYLSSLPDEILSYYIKTIKPTK